MTKLKYTKVAGALVSRGFNFDVSGEYDLPDDVAQYLLKTFSKNFEMVVAKKPEVAKVVKEPVKEVPKEPAKLVEEPTKEEPKVTGRKGTTSKK